MRTKSVRTIEGLPVVDADEDIIFEVTKRDVENSKKKDPANCAAAKAGKRILKTDVKVFLSRMYIKENKHWIRYLTPPSVSREIISFDRGSEFSPGEYVFKAASSQQRLGVSRRGGKATGIGKKKQVHHFTHNIRISAREI